MVLVGAGVGAAVLIALRGLARPRAAAVVFFDRPADPCLLQEAGPHVDTINVAGNAISPVATVATPAQVPAQSQIWLTVQSLVVNKSRSDPMAILASPGRVALIPIRDSQRPDL